MTALPPTEASCLLAGGTLYRTRVGLQTAAEAGELVFAGFKKGAFSLYFGDAPIYHFDLEGRWQRAYIESTHLLKGLDARVHAIDRVRQGSNLVLKRRFLEPDEASQLDLQVRSVALGLLGELDRGRVIREEPPAGKAQPLDNRALRDFLQRVAAWDAPAWARHRDQYAATYGPLPFLPPECQNAVVLQFTLGNPGGVSFGGGLVAEPRARAAGEFEHHVEQVVQLLGRRLNQCRTVFLAGSDVLRRPADDLFRALEIISERLPMAAGDEAEATDSPHLDGIHVFMDDFSPPYAGPEPLRGCHDRHLTHASLGIESGSPTIRKGYGRGWSNDDLRRWAADFQAAEIGLSVMVLVGGGGQEHAETHLVETAQLIESLELSRGSKVFLLDENEVSAGHEPSGMTPLLGDAWQQQQARLRAALDPLKDRGVKVLPYTLDKQWS